MFDAVLLGHIMNSIAFFGSATLIVLAGLIGVVASVSSIHDVVVKLPFVGTMSVALLSLKLGAIVSILIVSFFLFTYSLRKMTYTITLLAGLPEKRGGDKQPQELVDATAIVLTEAIKSFNTGIRGYYFAVAAIFLLIGPIFSIAVTTIIMALLLYRQLGTTTSQAIGVYVEALRKQTGDD